MRTISTCLSPQLLPLHSFEDKTVVVVDILRATSSMITAFAYDVASITPVPTLADCRMLKEQGYITAGERGGQKVSGFDLGNSPYEFMDHQLNGKDLAFTTTNGSQAILSVTDAHTIVLGSFLNLSATADFLLAQNGSVLILCAGWKGKFNIEDTLYAGALADLLQNEFAFEDDATLASQSLYQFAAPDLMGFLKKGSHPRRLAGFENHQDMEFCIQRDKFQLNAIFREGKLFRLEQTSII
ncbi:MAG: putative 2-phosphosulfolactate phosphatase [Cyclobacteriaceae bacterium]|nr:MAG: putative 2-phosphosulfolactate phosphatase [Cyclobacteriaceae bacterium]